MNDARRKEIRRVQALLEQAHEIIDQCANEERDYYDNMPENMQGSDKGTKADEDASALEDVASEIETQKDALGELVD